MADLGTVGVSADCDHLVQAIAFYSVSVVASTGKTVSGTVLDDTATPAARTVRLYNRATGALVGATISDGVTGEYSIAAPDLEVDRIVLDDSGGSLYNDIIDRVLPGP